MATYTWNGTEFVDRDGAPMAKPFAGQIVCPTVISDIPEYTSPIDGTPITSRSSRREDLKRSGCVEYEPSLSPVKDGIRNKAFAKKRGLQLGEAYR